MTCDKPECDVGKYLPSRPHRYDKNWFHCVDVWYDGKLSEIGPVLPFKDKLMLKGVVPGASRYISSYNSNWCLSRPCGWSNDVRIIHFSFLKHNLT